jgi:hypothetical protein
VFGIYFCDKNVLEFKTEKKHKEGKDVQMEKVTASKLGVEKGKEKRRGNEKGRKKLERKI